MHAAERDPHPSRARPRSLEHDKQVALDARDALAARRRRGTPGPTSTSSGPRPLLHRDATIDIADESRAPRGGSLSTSWSSGGIGPCARKKCLGRWAVIGLPVSSALTKFGPGQ